VGSDGLPPPAAWGFLTAAAATRTNMAGTSPHPHCASTRPVRSRCAGRLLKATGPPFTPPAPGPPPCPPPPPPGHLRLARQAATRSSPDVLELPSATGMADAGAADGQADMLFHAAAAAGSAAVVRCCWRRYQGLRQRATAVGSALAPCGRAWHSQRMERLLTAAPHAAAAANAQRRTLPALALARGNQAAARVLLRAASTCRALAAL
jgi:hypothetical protein